jgi:3-deoxy-D-manno-octulosonate 8-phosphate phosphatase (KDO 8-P phosphatase)
MIKLENIELFVFDFDGVLTDNRVLVDADGKESVKCNRADGLAFDVLRHLKKAVVIMSTEKNKVVARRAEKLQVEVYHGVRNKAESLLKLCKERNLQLKNVLFVGNDLNDYHVMKLCAYSACPSDSHDQIKKISKIILKSKGGEGVIRELLEDALQMNFLEILTQ